jgi:hypothetical protein
MGGGSAVSAARRLAALRAHVDSELGSMLAELHSTTTRDQITITASTAAWEKLLAALPRCARCGTRAEVEIAAEPLCCGCAASVPDGRCRQLEHAALAERIGDACSAFDGVSFDCGMCFGRREQPEKKRP